MSDVGGPGDGIQAKAGLSFAEQLMEGSALDGDVFGLGRPLGEQVEGFDGLGAERVGLEEVPPLRLAHPVRGRYDLGPPELVPVLDSIENAPEPLPIDRDPVRMKKASRHPEHVVAHVEKDLPADG